MHPDYISVAAAYHFILPLLQLTLNIISLSHSSKQELIRMDIPILVEEEPVISSIALPPNCLICTYSQMSPSVVVRDLSDDVPGPSQLSTLGQLHWEEIHLSQNCPTAKRQQ